MDGPSADNGQLRLGKDSIGKYSLDKDSIGKDSIDINNKLIITNGIMTEQQLLQAIYLEKIKDRNAENIIECVSYLKYLPIEVIKSALEKTSLQAYPQWSYAKELLENWIKQGINNISDIEKNNNSNNFETDGFKRKGDEVLNGK